jgi:hypothetical protein
VLKREKNDCVCAYLNASNRDPYAEDLEVFLEHFNQEMKFDSEISGEQIREIKN